MAGARSQVTAACLSGKEVAARIRSDVAMRAELFRTREDRPPSLSAVLVGDDPASLAYARSKIRAAEAAGIAFNLVRIPSGVRTETVVAAVARLNADGTVDGIIVELPLPRGLDRRAVQGAIEPAKDVDGACPESQSRLYAGIAGPRPATALAVMALLEEAKVELEGARATVVGRSLVIGRPVALLLVEANATVTVAHTRTRDLAGVCREAEILVAAAGSPGLVAADHVRPGAVVIDVGTTVTGYPGSERIVGDVAASALDVAGAVSPVPGGVGPVTTAILLRTAIELAEARAAARRGG